MCSGRSSVGDMIVDRADLGFDMEDWGFVFIVGALGREVVCLLVAIEDVVDSSGRTVLSEEAMKV